MTQMRSSRHDPARSAALRAACSLALAIVALLGTLGMTAPAASAEEHSTEADATEDVAEATDSGDDCAPNAEEAEGEGKIEELEAEGPEPPLALIATATPYLDELLAAINRRRGQAGTAPLTYASETANAALSRHVEEMTPVMAATGTCGHGLGDPPRYGWDAVAETGFTGQGRGEVIACPDDNGSWTATRTADVWWESASHQMILYADPNANAVVCGAHGPQRGGSAYRTIVCVTYRV